MNLQQLYELRLAENEAGEEIAQLPRLVDRPLQAPRTSA